MSLNPEIRDRVQGHVPRTEGKGYGDVPPDVMLREISRLLKYVILLPDKLGVSLPSSHLTVSRRLRCKLQQITFCNINDLRSGVNEFGFVQACNPLQQLPFAT